MNMNWLNGGQFIKSTLAVRTTARLVHEYELAEWRPVH
jgi:hypothetical protein